MSREQQFIDRLKPLARDPGARGLIDDAAVLAVGNETLVLTHDMLVEGVHYLPADPPADVAWKLVAVNLSDLAAKGAVPVAALMGYTLGPDADWDAAFVAGLGAALGAFALPLLGGDTVTMPQGRALGLTAIGRATGPVPSRGGVQAGDQLWVTGRIGAARLGLAIAKGMAEGPEEWLTAYRRPMPRLAWGQALGPRVHAMADVSDGLLIDARRMAAASGLGVTIALETVPIVGDDALAAVTAGDDYELLFAAPPGFAPPSDCIATLIGGFAPGEGLRLTRDGAAIALPARLGYEHD
ncbi:thiamine-monophosphate kinase [Sphingomonas vulcanisoli]|uniref:Thiamine-monophosphate kinase n=1 Tax=Sphingomonas vulcanisoli TaxID=1658060 RepID=A0ABX0TY20_9SPHN|nr:thiamine-phosphate kinase [Sphingomonas vulcanisoli]NIJ09094.1 thiamine-monophosphate kinase [Sphingomonas vulcanisoli]